MISILVLNYNNPGDTIECIASILDSTYLDYRIVLLDNGSVDNSLEEIRTWSKTRFKNIIELSRHELHDLSNGAVRVLSSDLVIIDNRENLGFAAGNNVGIRFSLLLGANYIFVLNNDTILLPDTLDKLVRFFKLNPAYDVLTPQIRYYNAMTTIWNCGGKLIGYAYRKYFYNDQNIHTVPTAGHKKISFATGCALLIKSDLIRKIGPFTERFFFGEEDFELSIRLKKNKINMACVFDAIMYHKVSRTMNSVNYKSGKIYIHYLNRFINLKNVYNPVVWNLLRGLYLANLVLILKVSYKYGMKEIIRLCRLIISHSNKMETVDREHFQTYIGKTDF